MVSLIARTDSNILALSFAYKNEPTFCSPFLLYSTFIASIHQQEASLHQQIGLKFKDEHSKVLHVEHSFVWCCNLDTSENRS
jgi:hypothetical protein